MKGRPVVLIAATGRWFPTARLGMALASAGFAVEAICPTGHPLNKIRAVGQRHDYHALAPLTSFATAITAAKPDLIVPSDDLATQHLQDLCLGKHLHGEDGAVTRALIERSIGPATNFPLTRSRTAFLKLAQQEGIRVPRTEVIKNADELRGLVVEMGLPVMLKADATSSGEGIEVVRTLGEAERTFRRLQAPPTFVRAVGRALVNRDLRFLCPAILRSRYVMNAQVHIQGRDATSTVACWKGSVLAALHFEVLNKRSPTGSSTVLRLVEKREMSNTIERLADRLDLSGLYGFDFVLESGTGNAYLIEMNPRATQVSHLTLGPGRDIPAALYAAVSGKEVQEAPKLTESDTIALFPQEWIRNPASTYLRTSFHDIPWQEPELIRVCVHKRWSGEAWYSRRKWAEFFFGTQLPRL
jgi:hypothetical protein